MKCFGQEYLIAKRDKYMTSRYDSNIEELIFKIGSYYPVLSITTDLESTQHHEIAYQYDDVETPSIVFVESSKIDKYFYTDKEIRKMKLEEIDNVGF